MTAFFLPGPFELFIAATGIGVFVAVTVFLIQLKASSQSEGSVVTKNAKATGRRPAFRFRVIPALVFTVLGALLVLGCGWNAINGVWIWSNHGLILLAGIAWIMNGVAWHRGTWWWATGATLTGFVLPMFRPIW